MTDGSVDELPRVVWILWFQGFDAAPPIVRECLHSWQKRNASWQVIELNQENVGSWLDLPSIIGASRPDVTLAALSDVVRINLLGNYGGVWVDSTCFCCKPLDTWLGSCMGSGFFAFENPGVDRLLSSWFLASTKDCYLTARLRDAVNSFWKRHYFSNQQTKLGKELVRQLSKIFNRNPALTRFWLRTPVSRGLRVYPYYVFHYLFADLIRQDEHARRIWDGRCRYSARFPHRVRMAGLSNALPDSLKQIIDARQDPVYKLSWKHVPKEYAPGCVLDYLLHSTE